MYEYNMEFNLSKKLNNTERERVKKQTLDGEEGGGGVYVYSNF